MSENKQEVCLFDFDGTLTRRDTLIEFIRYAKGTGFLLFALLRLSPLLILMKLHLYNNGKTKERLFSLCFKGMPTDSFNTLCRRFADSNRQRLLRKDGMAEVEKRLSGGARVMVVSASVDNWVAPFFNSSKQPEIVGTQIEVVDGRITGRFTTPNCYGKEKTRRVEALLSKPRSHYRITAFGDSRGDMEMLNYADKGYYKPFNG